MRRPSSTQTFLILLTVITCALETELHAQSQLPAPTNNSFALIEKKWTHLPAEELFKAAQANDPQALYFYWRIETGKARQEEDRLWGHYLALKNKLPADEQKSLWGKWKSATDEEVEQAAQRGDIEAQIVNYWRKSMAAAARPAKLFPFLEKSAEQGFPPAEGKAALHYLFLAGWVLTDDDQGQIGGHPLIDTNRTKGVELLRRAADDGWVEAQFHLGTIYLHGHLLPPDMVKAVEWFQKAADQDDPSAQFELAMLYASGCGVPRDGGDAPVVLLRKAAAKNNVPALYESAERYRIGMGVSVDYVQAARQYVKAWQASTNGGWDPRGTARGILNLLDAKLIPKPGLTKELAPFARVFGVYLKATQRHDATAMSQIGEWYFSGRFVPKDMVEAFRWFHLAANSGAVDARKRQDEIKSKLSPDELERALKLPEAD